ncbi:MAG: MarR family transcriptional regulator [Dyadobacter sp. 50-39]|uniref:MarR family winged helix-turn-helix transcriptional regulator n=1 Tax=Dyadobacter sp. 50-39 TaxID=1895756 RepID=UPI00095C5291|nr:MarR family transcriptional regulator [Dyadobacter sp. 50-39]OJV22666.1 MAG: MarR family transcriptional regulator [Dyadobacter sp. 50-39]
MNQETFERVRKLSQKYAFDSIQMHEAIGRQAGLSGTDHKYLGFLIQKGQMTAGELSALTGLTTGAVTGLIDRFEQKDLVRRRYGEGDRRKVIVEPNTEKIMAVFEPLYKDFRSKTEQVIASFSEQELAVIESYFLKATEVMNETTSKLTTK